MFRGWLNTSPKLKKETGAGVTALSVELLGIKNVSKKLKQGCCDNSTNGC